MTSEAHNNTIHKQTTYLVHRDIIAPYSINMASSQKGNTIECANSAMVFSPKSVMYEDTPDGESTIIFEEGFEVPRRTTPVRMRVHTPSPSRRRQYNTPSPLRRQNKLLTPIRAFSFRRRKKNRVPPGPDHEATLAIRRNQWEEERERIRVEERKKKLFDFEVGSSCLSISCQCWGGSLLLPGDDDY